MSSNLIYLEYKYNTFFDVIYDENDCISINISKDRGTVIFNYGDSSYKEYKISLVDFIELDKILKKYDSLNWNKYKEKDKEIIDGDNTFISFRYDNGEYHVISSNEYPIGKNLVFRDISLYLNKLKS